MNFSLLYQYNKILMNKKILLKRRPVGAPVKEDFEVKIDPISVKLEQGEILVKVEWLSVDPAQTSKK